MAGDRRGAADDQLPGVLTTTLIRQGGRRVMVSTPNVLQYGHLGLEMQASLVVAKRSGACVYFERPPKIAGEALFELESPEVPILRPGPLTGKVLHAHSVASEMLKTLWIRRSEFRGEFRRKLAREIGRHVNKPTTPPLAKDDLRAIRDRLRNSGDRIMRGRPGYFRRRMLRTEVPVRLNPQSAAEAARQAIAHGIDPAARLVCIHARESGYKLGQEMQDTKPETGRDDKTRNARIESYFEACDDLVRQGYTVIRLGDPTMTPVLRPGIVDLATSPRRTNLLEVHCLLRSDLLIAGESGLFGVGHLLNVPILLVHVTEPIAAYPVRAPGLFVPKRIVDRQTGQPLSHADQVSDAYHLHLRDSRRFLYFDSTPAQIADATREMLDWIAGRWVESEDQRRYHNSIVAAAQALKARSRYARKWGSDRGFLGDGRIARAGL
jgi:putative glycosyltransferase (TIGR04372 family)